MSEAPNSAKDAGSAAKRPSGLLRMICCLYLAALVGAWAFLYAGDTWWPATFLLFGPRWLFAVPLIVLVPLAAWLRPRLLIVLLVAAVVALGPLMGFVVPWSHLLTSAPEGPKLRILSCNMHYGKYDAAPLDELLREVKPDVVLLQEWHRANRSSVMAEPGWHAQRNGSLFLASRFPVRKVEVLGKYSMDPQGLVERCEIDTPAGLVTIFNLHLASPRLGLSQVAEEEGAGNLESNSELRRQQSEFIAGHAEKVKGPLFLAGDFNTTPESVLFRSVWTDYRDAFSSAGWGWGYTFSTRIIATRIDHILLGKGWYCSRCWIGPFVGSLHRPVLADVIWMGDG